MFMNVSMRHSRTAQTATVAVGVVLNAPSKRLPPKLKWSSRPIIFSLHHQTLVTIQHSFKHQFKHSLIIFKHGSRSCLLLPLSKIGVSILAARTTLCDVSDDEDHDGKVSYTVFLYESFARLYMCLGSLAPPFRALSRVLTFKNHPC
jgi:hypothetical protein